MPDDLKTLKLTETEINLVLDTLHAFEPDGTGWEQVDLNELADDLREQLHRHDDGWGDPDDADLLMDPVDFAAKHDIDPISIVICDAEINAEMATSRAAERRALKFSPAGQGAKASRPAPQPKGRSEIQDVDVWDANDPKNW